MKVKTIHEIAIALWDSILENRIRLQKMLVDVNKLPQCEMYKKINEIGVSQIKDPLYNSKFFENTYEACRIVAYYTKNISFLAQQKLLDLLHNMLILQQSLYASNNDMMKTLEKTGDQSRDQDDDDEDIPSDVDEQTSEAIHDLENDEEKDYLILPRKRKLNMVKFLFIDISFS